MSLFLYQIHNIFVCTETHQLFFSPIQTYFSFISLKIYYSSKDIAANSSVHPAPHANLDTFSDSPMLRVCFVGCTHMLNGCIVGLENNNDVTGELLKPSDPNCPYTRIHPWYFDLGSKFPLSPFLKEILIFYQIGLCNLTPSFIRIVTCFERLDNWYRDELGLLVFLTLYTMQRSIELGTTFSPDLTLGGLPTSLICLGRINISKKKTLSSTGISNEIYLGQESSINLSVILSAKLILRTSIYVALS